MVSPGNMSIAVGLGEERAVLIVVAIVYRFINFHRLQKPIPVW